MTKFTLDVRLFLKRLPKDHLLNNDSKQLWKSSSSIGANFLEAQESMSKKDFLYRIRIARKEARESLFWLTILQDDVPSSLKLQHTILLKECMEIVKILSAIAKTTQARYQLD